MVRLDPRQPNVRRVHVWPWLVLGLCGCARGAPGLRTLDEAAEVGDAGIVVEAGDGKDAGLDPAPSTTDAGTDAGAAPDAGPTGPDGPEPEPPRCEPVHGCHAARYIGAISGDVASVDNHIVADGTRSTWLSVRLEETSTSLAGLALRLALSMDSDADYDLFVYAGDDATAMGCGEPLGQSVAPGSETEMITTEFDDQWFGSDDSRAITIEVRSASAVCAAFQLDARGP